MNKYLIKSYNNDEKSIEKTIEADSVWVDGSVAQFSIRVKANVGQDNEYDDFENVATIDISQMFFIKVG